jgi:hypothetical protein
MCQLRLIKGLALNLIGVGLNTKEALAKAHLTQSSSTPQRLHKPASQDESPHWKANHQISGHKFRLGCRWSELPGRGLLITGVGDPAVRELEKI